MADVELHQPEAAAVVVEVGTGEPGRRSALAAQHRRDLRVGHPGRPREPPEVAVEEPLRQGGERVVQVGEVVLDQAKVAIVPGEGFGAPGYARLSYALGDDDLAEGVRRIGELLAR